MPDRRRKNGAWFVADEDGRIYNSTRMDPHFAILATLLDVRDELQTLNQVFRCPNFLQVPGLLRVIAANTTKPLKKRRRRKK
jgi:hypothetical protein